MAKWAALLSSLLWGLTACGVILEDGPEGGFFTNDDGGLITGEPCGPPCLEGITPGLSTEEDVMALLQRAGLRDRCTVTHHQTQGKRIVQCGGSIGFSVDDSTLAVESISYSPPGEIRVGDLLEANGDPSYLLVIEEGRPDQPIISARMVYDRLKMIVLLSQVDGTQYLVTADTPLLSVSYSDGDRFDEFLTLNSGLLLEWRGYGTYSQAEEGGSQ
jgi:hypothetical protein